MPVTLFANRDGKLPWRTFVILCLLFLGSSRFDVFYSINGPPPITGLAENRADDALKAISLLGLLLWSVNSLWKHRRYAVDAKWIRTGLMGMFCIWNALSLCWTDDLSLTLNKVLILFLTIVVSLAVAYRFSLREIAMLVFVFSAASNFLGLCSEICLGTFQPWDPMYRFSGLWHPNTHGLSLSLLVLAGLALWRGETKGKKWIAAVTAFGAVMLLLTRSRTSFGSTCIVAGITWLLLATPKQRWTTILAGSIAGFGLTFISANNLVSLPVDSVLMGRQDTEASTLTNRIPLWKDCAVYIAQRPWAGYGYGGFWTPTRIRTVTAPEEIARKPETIKYVPDGSFLPDAHNLYIETVLGTGFIGCAFLVGGLLISIVVLAFKTFRRHSISSGFAFSVITFLCLEAMLEAISPQPGLPFLIGPLLLAKTAFIGDRRNLKKMEVPKFTAPEPLSSLEVTHA